MSRAQIVRWSTYRTVLRADRAWEAVFHEITAEITKSMAPELKKTLSVKNISSPRAA
jgi:hypothetical protein